MKTLKNIFVSLSMFLLLFVNLYAAKVETDSVKFLQTIQASNGVNVIAGTLTGNSSGITNIPIIVNINDGGTNSAGFTNNTLTITINTNASTVSSNNSIRLTAIESYTNAINVIYTNSYSFSFVDTQSSTNFALTGFNFNTPFIGRGRLYISDTNVIPFSQTARLTFNDNNIASDGTTIWQSDMGLTAQLLTNSIAVGGTNLYIYDTSDLAANNLVYLTGATNEFVRILYIESSTNMILKYATVASHEVTNGCARVREFSGFKLWNSGGSNTIYGSIALPAPTNVTINLKLEYAQ